MNYKLFLDDERSPPNNEWILCRWPQEVIHRLQVFYGRVEEISLDHDLGNDEVGTGYDVLTWLEAQVFNDPSYPVPKIHVHSANSSARIRMLSAIESINRFKNTQ